MADITPDADFGSRLRRLREARGVSLREIASATHLSMAQLEALERNDVRRLPAGIFRRGIVRAYAQEIGADPEATVRDFIASIPGEPGIGDSSRSYQTDYEATTAAPPISTLTVIVAGLAVLAALAGWLVFTLV